MDDEIEAPERLRRMFDNTLDGAGFRDVELYEKLCVQRARQGPGIAGGFFVLICHCEVCAGLTSAFGNGIRDRVIVRNAGDQAFLSGERTRAIGPCKCRLFGH